MTHHSILIIDDEANQRLMIEQALHAFDADWIITTAASGAEALAFAKQQTPDLIITDYHMPDMNGIDVITQVRHHGMRSHIILITAYSSCEIGEAARLLSVDHYVTKPVTVAHLRHITATTLSKTG